MKSNFETNKELVIILNNSNSNSIKNSENDSNAYE